jgi:hypothetical protein
LPNRRSFLALGSSVAIVSALSEKLFAQSSSSDVFSARNLEAYSQGAMTQSKFEGVVGSFFTIELGTGRYASLKLVSVKAVASSASTPAQPAVGKLRVLAGGGSAPVAPPSSSKFNLNFSSGFQLVPQGTYTLDHGTLGKFPAFLVPGDPVHGGTCSACFNLL